MLATGTAIGHAGELLQGAVSEADTVCPFLITLPAPWLKSAARVSPDAGPDSSVTPAGKRKALTAALLFLRRHGVRDAIHLTIRSSIPVGRGCGSSTSDCVAAVRAAAALARVSAGPDEIARVVNDAERATDPTMYESVVAFRHRHGTVLRRLAQELPPARVLVIDAAPETAGIDTLCLPERQYSGDELREYGSLLDRFGVAIAARSLPCLAAVARASADLNQAFLPTPNYDAYCRLARKAGAHGLAIAHSGTTVSLLFSPGAVLGPWLTRDIELLGGGVVTPSWGCGLPALEVLDRGATGATIPPGAGNAGFEHTTRLDELRRDAVEGDL
jgi:uncharacterized protein involved in propanediol utilization